MLKLPDDIENILIQAAQTADKSYWQIGDVTNDLCLTLNGMFQKTEIREVVSSLIAWEPETVRDQQRMSELIPSSKRHYNLSRHQYRACLNAGTKWEEYAVRAVAYAEDISNAGKSAPVNMIREWIKGKSDIPKWKQWLERLIDLAEKISRDETAPESVKTVVKSLLNLA